MHNYVNDYIAEHNTIHFETFVEKYRRIEVLKFMNRYPHRTILDVGCGLQFYFTDLNEASFDKYIVIEKEKRFVDEAQRNIYDYGNIIVEHTELENWNSEGQKFDLIILSSVLHLVHNIDIFLSKIHTICNRNTKIHINVPNSKSLHKILGSCMGLELNSDYDIMFDHQFHFDKKLLQRHLQDNGFQIITSGSYLIKPFSDTQMTCLVDSKIVDGLNNMASILPNYGCEIFVEAKINEMCKMS